MNEDEQRTMLRSAQQMQNVQFKTTLGLIAGGVLGLIVGAWMVLPYFGMTWMGILGAFGAIVVGAIIGQRLVLNMLAR